MLAAPKVVGKHFDFATKIVGFRLIGKGGILTLQFTRRTKQTNSVVPFNDLSSPI
jgi:hypothetical protein